MFEESAGVIPVYKDSGEVLLVHHITGHWGFPKGHLERGEGAKQAALRELKEETGLEEVILQGGPVVNKYYFEKDGVQIEKKVSYFVGTVYTKDVTIKQDEIQAFAWLPYQEALERLTYSREVLKTAASENPEIFERTSKQVV